MDDADLLHVVLLAVRVAAGLTLAAHGYQKVFLGGRIPGTARWFESLGMHPGRLHAWLAATTEITSGLGFAAGLLTPLCAAGCVGVMFVAYWTHRGQFFVFKDGWEYTVSIAVAAWAIATIGPGDASLDHAIGWEWTAWDGWIGAVLSAVLGLGGALLQLAVCYRPQPAAATS